MSAHQLVKAAERMTTADVDAVLLLLAVNTGVDPNAAKAVITALVRAAGGMHSATVAAPFTPTEIPGVVNLPTETMRAQQ